MSEPSLEQSSPAGIVPTWLFNGLAVLVATTWAGSLVADALMDSYSPSPAIHGAMMVVLGAVFGVRIVKGGAS